MLGLGSSSMCFSDPLTGPTDQLQSWWGEERISGRKFYVITIISVVFIHKSNQCHKEMIQSIPDYAEIMLLCQNIP